MKLVASDDPYHSEDDQNILYSITDISNTIMDLSRFHEFTIEQNLEDTVKKHVKTKYYQNKYNLLGINKLPNPER